MNAKTQVVKSYRRGKHPNSRNGFKKGHPCYITECSEKTREKIRTAKIGKNWNWKGGISKTKDYINFHRNRYQGLRRKLKKYLSFEEWTKIKSYFSNQCVNCRKVEKLTIDHIKPISRGGSGDINNIQPLCLMCNLKKGKQEINYIEKWYFEESLLLNNLININEQPRP